jgi:hypothetical protein
LFGAAFWGWTDVVKFLAAHGAKLDMQDAQGRTAVDAALGRAGGHERGASIKVFKETADALLQLCSQQQGCKIAVPAPASS